MCVVYVCVFVCECNVCRCVCVCTRSTQKGCVVYVCLCGLWRVRKFSHRHTQCTHRVSRGSRVVPEQTPTAPGLVQPWSPCLHNPHLRSLCLAEKKCETHDRVSEEIPYFFTKFLTIPFFIVLFYGVSSNSKLTGIYSIPELRCQFKKAWRKALGGEMLRDQQNLSCVGNVIIIFQNTIS